MTRFIPPAVLYTLVVSLGGFIFGFDASVISGAVGFVSQEFALSDWQQGMLVSAPTLAALIAMLFAGNVCDRFGRRNTLIGIAALYLSSALLSAFAPNFESLLVARFIGGLAFCSLMIAPIYIAEISSSEHRGKLVSVNQLNIVLGFSVSYFSNYFLLQSAQSPETWLEGLTLWRVMLAMEVIPALAWLLLLFFIPKSPRWLLLNDQEDAAKSMLNKLSRFGHSAPSFEHVKAALKAEQNANVASAPLFERIKAVFAPSMYSVLIIGLILAVVQQVTGINVVFFYAPTIFEQSGVGTNAAFMQAVWIGIINVVFTLVAMLGIDRFGRKPLLVVGLVGIFVSLSVCAYGFKKATYQLEQAHISQITAQISPQEQQALATIAGHSFMSDVAFKNALKQHLSSDNYRTVESTLLQNAADINALLILLGISGFVASFAMSLGPVMWVMLAEIFPSAVRGLAMSFISVVNGLCSFLVQLIFPWELNTLGAAFTFASYAAFALIGLILVVKYLPETKGQSLESLSNNLNRDTA